MPEPETLNQPVPAPSQPGPSDAAAASSPSLPAKAGTALALPENLISSIDLSRTIRELAALDESLYQANVRVPGQSVKLARSSRILEDLATANGVSLLDTAKRGELLSSLKSYAKTAPRIHMSFAVEPSAKFSTRMVVWLRQNIDPLILLEIGLQPTLAVGCMVRTNNRFFDMSLRHRFKEQRHILREKIGRPPETAAPAVSEVATP